MNFNHLPLTTEDGTQLNLDALYKIAPSCFTEARDEKTGALRHVVDFKKLRQLLGDNAVEDEPEAYEFTWVGKNAARREAAMPINKTLRPVPESSVDWDHTQNIYIEGDNLDALKLLQKSYLGKVKMIYIDPPYNTGNDFVYHDDFHRTQAEEDLEAGNVDELGNRFVKNTETNGKFHSDWCSMIYPRLQLAHSLLSEDGVIFISIDDNEVENLRKICDEVFGETNFIAQLIWERAYAPKNDSKYISNSHDYVLMFAKNIDNFVIGRLDRTAEANSRYNNPDNDPRGVWKPSDMWGTGFFCGRALTITNPKLA
jgi:adenine-specific DNA-methyltransferase